MAKTVAPSQAMTTTQAVPRWAVRMRQLQDFLTYDFPVGAKSWKAAWVINFQKTGTFPFLLMLIWVYGNPTSAAWIYVALHGSYGIAWILKDTVFPDRGWQRRVPIIGGINLFLFLLGWYWVFGWLLISGASRPTYPLSRPVWFALCISLFTLGLTVMLSADAQKHFTLKYSPGLITTGMFRHVRHPNYLGEMMIYGALALLVWHWLPLIVLAWVWIGIFAVNMIHKEASMSRYPEWEAYRARTGWLLPKFRKLAASSVSPSSLG
jgi:protein-S-isoprenylcysteine O-methyltransferase Ste14